MAHFFTLKVMEDKCEGTAVFELNLQKD